MTRLGMTAVNAVAISAFFLAAGSAQTDPRGRRHTLFGTVENINEFAQSLRIKQEKIAGYSEARLATYRVEDASILKKLEVGDRIVAAIYEKDDALHDIRVARIIDSPPDPPLRRK